MDVNPTESRTLWLGDLDPFMDEAFLTATMLSLNWSEELASIKVIKDKQTGQSLKYGFLEFTSHKSAQKFMREFNGKMFPNVAHKYMKIKWASYGGGVKPTSIVPSSTTGQISVYVGDLDPSINEAKLLEFFKTKYPSAFTSKIIYDASTRQSKGYGFVKFTNSTEAQRAITQCNGQQLNGRTIKVSHAYMKNKEENRDEEEQNETEAGHMIKIYQQFYSMMNDPILKAAYEKQMEQSFGGEWEDQKNVKSRLEGLRSLSYEQTRSSEKYVESLPRWVTSQAKQKIESHIFCD